MASSLRGPGPGDIRVTCGSPAGELEHAVGLGRLLGKAGGTALGVTATAVLGVARLVALDERARGQSRAKAKRMAMPATVVIAMTASVTPGREKLIVGLLVLALTLFT